MQVVTRGAAGRADLADDVAALDLGALLDGVALEVPVAGLEPEAMVDDDQVPVCALVADVRDLGRYRGRRDSPGRR
jgi:hypothetical protein